MNSATSGTTCTVGTGMSVSVDSCAFNNRGISSFVNGSTATASGMAIDNGYNRGACAAMSNSIASRVDFACSHSSRPKCRCEMAKFGSAN